MLFFQDWQKKIGISVKNMENLLVDISDLLQFVATWNVCSKLQLIEVCGQ